MLAAPAAAAGELGRQRRLAGARGADDQRAGAFFDAAAEQRIELRDVARQSCRACVDLPMFGGDQPRKDLRGRPS